MRTDPKPAAAWWDPKQNEWVHGAKDDQGRLVGEVRYWNADGVLISTAEHVAGKPHGIARRYFRNGEIAQDARYVDGVIASRRFLRASAAGLDDPRSLLSRVGSNIAVCECVYEAGDLIGMLYFDGDGRELTERGRPMPPRPAGLPPTAWHLEGQGWFWSRRRGEDGHETIESREWHDSGALRSQDGVSGADCEWYANGKPKHEGRRNRTGARHFKIGTWRHFDNRGRLRRISEYDDTGAEIRRSWHRPAREATKAGGVSREGGVSGDCEVGPWIVKSAKGRTMLEVDLGSALDDKQLLAHAAAGDHLDDDYQPAPSDRSLPATLARARRAGIQNDPLLLGLTPAPAWQELDDDGPQATGKRLPLWQHQPYGRALVTLVHALRWGPPDAALLAEIAAQLFRKDRAQAALDVIDAARALGDEPAFQTARISYLRALGRADEADRMTSRGDRLDDRARVLLEEICASPDDDGPRLVLADHLAATFPQHAALIVAQCQGTPDTEHVRAFLATLPKWLRDHRDKPVRGFLDNVWCFKAEDFVNAEPDLLYRVAPTCRQLDLMYASDQMATLVTLPALRRYRELSFTDTYFFAGQAEQLASCRYLEHLEHLGLYATSLGDEELLPLVRSTAYPRLQSLEIGRGRDESNCTMAAIRALATAAFAPTLRWLHMTNRWLGDEVIEVIAQLPALVDLDLSGGSLTDDGARALAALPHAFTTLALGGNELTEEGRRIVTDRFGAAVSFAR